MKDKNICLIDYGMGNIQSVVNAFKKLDQNLVVSSLPEDLDNADALILPGVGAFNKAMSFLNKLNLIDSIIENTKKRNKPFLGICLGMQLLAENSTEIQWSKGLGLISGSVERIDCSNKLALPHVGWNNVSYKPDSILFDELDKNPCFYFVHSYCFKTQEKYITSTTDYGIKIVSSVQHENIMGVQFHPEKSQRKGLKLLSNFLKQI